MNACKRKLPLLTLLGLLFSLVTAGFAMADIAAKIEYEFVSCPDALSNFFAARDKVDLKFLRLTTIDGFVTSGALWQPAGKSPADTTIVIMIHGSGASYKRIPQSALGGNLAAAGFAALSIDTRQHDDAINTENFFDVRKDIEAAVLTAKALGYRKIVLQGHSLGNIQVQFYAATNWDRDIKGVILLGAFGNLPWKTRNLLVQDEDRFRQLAAQALDALRNGTESRELPTKMPYYTGQQTIMTGQHFLTYRWDKTSAADGTFWIRRIPQPILLARDQADGVIQPFEPYMLLDAAHAEGSLVQSIDYVLIPNTLPPSGQGHLFDGNERPLADTIIAWLQRHNL